MLLIVVLALAGFFWREAGYYKFEVAQMQAQAVQANQLVEALGKQDLTIAKQMQTLKGVVDRLSEYGRLHPDYAQILAKYGVPVQPAAPTAPPKK